MLPSSTHALYRSAPQVQSPDRAYYFAAEVSCDVGGQIYNTQTHAW